MIYDYNTFVNNYCHQGRREIIKKYWTIFESKINSTLVNTHIITRYYLEADKIPKEWNQKTTNHV